MIRGASVEDLSRVAALERELDALHRRALPWLVAEPATLSTELEYLTRFLADPNCAVFVADEGGTLLGAARVLVRPTRNAPAVRPASVVELEAMVVAAEYRRRGYGSALVRAAEAWGRERGGDRLELGVYEFNEEARRFYEFLGFETLSRRLRRPLE